MKVIVIVLLLFLVLLAYEAPTFYEAYIEHDVLRVSRNIASDLIWARRQSIKTSNNYGVVFIKGQNPGYYIFIDKDNNGKFDMNDTVIKTVNLKDISSYVKFSNAFDDKDVVFMENTFVFNSLPQPLQQSAPGHDSIFLINKNDDVKGVMERMIRVYVDKTTNDIKILRIKETTDKGDIIFADIDS
ncbi:MAG: hypothetical protein NTY22_00470 [Proteobacteria bacterium]|nr:hypothetical protein [Pseudomonadota bacterium]